jgi:hypothetical protein
MKLTEQQMQEEIDIVIRHHKDKKSELRSKYEHQPREFLHKLELLQARTRGEFVGMRHMCIATAQGLQTSSLMLRFSFEIGQVLQKEFDKAKAEVEEMAV